MDGKNYTIYFMQTFGILLVVLGHSFYQTKDGNVVVEWIYSFHMPLFMFVSGYLLDYTSRLKGIALGSMRLWGRGGFLTRKERRLLVPYVAISSAVFIPKAFFPALAARPVSLAPGDYLSMLIYPYDNVIGSFWFMPTIFIIFVAAAYAARVLPGRSLPLLAYASLAADALFGLCRTSPLNVLGAAYYMAYVAMGFWFSRSGLEKALSPKAAAAVAVATAGLSVAFVAAPQPRAWLEVAAAANGILMSLALGKLYVAARLRFLNHLYGATFTIYLLSWFPQVASQQLLLSVANVPWPVTTALAFATGVYAPLAAYHWLLAHKHGRLGRLLALATGL